MTIRRALLAVLFAAAPACAQLDWTHDLPAQLKAMQDAGPASPLPAVHASAPKASAASAAIEGTPRAGKDFLAADAGHQHTVQDYLAVKGSGIEAIHSDCDDTVDDCTFLFFDFPQLESDAKTRTLAYKGELVAAFTPGGSGITLLNGYALKAQTADAPGGYRLSMKLEKAAASYRGILTLAHETREICFTLSAEKIDQFEGDPDISQGVFVYQPIASLREEGPSYKGQCATSLEHNGDYIRTCSGLFLTGAGTLSKGDVFTDLARFDPNTGALKLAPAGTFELKKVDACR